MSDNKETGRVLEALATISGVRRVTRGWAREPAGEALPAIVVHKSGERGAGFRDDSEYITRVEYTVRVFAALAQDADALAAEALRVMRDLGYARAFEWEESDGIVNQRLFRFERYM